jgi:hypothetical protein
VTPTYYIVFYTDGERKYGNSEAERAALWDTLTAFAGPYHFDGKTLTVAVDTSWNEVYNGTQQVRNVELRGKRMLSSSAPRPWGRDPSVSLAHGWKVNSWPLRAADAADSVKGATLTTCRRISAK